MKWNIKELVKDYAPPEGDELLFTEEDTDVLILKDIVHNYLETYDRTILLMYAELGSLRLVAKELNVSHTAAIKKMDQIKLQVMGEFYRRKAEALNNKINRQLHDDTHTT
jgi:hypothetical protein